MNYIIKNKKLIYQNDSTCESAIDYQNIKDKELIEEIIIPEGVKYIFDSSFKDFTNLKKVQLPKSLQGFGYGVFSNCINLEKITIPANVSLIPAKMFSNCISLKKITYLGNIKAIDRCAFENCSSLSEINLPQSLESIDVMAFFGCKKVKEIHIPKKVSNIGYGAFSCIDSLTKITVDKGNEKYISLDNIALINEDDGILIQYAIGSKNKSFKLGKYQVHYNNNFLFDDNGVIYDIADLAFANAKNLKEIQMHSEIDSIGAYTFKGCDNLKILKINKSSFGKILSFHIHENPTIFKKENNEEYELPFEEIIIGEGIKEISIGMEKLFKNAKFISLPTSLERIGANAFKLNNYIKKFCLSKNIQNIEQDAFNDEVLLIFEEFGIIKSNEFKILTTKTSDDITLLNQNKDVVKILLLKDNSYRIIIDDFEKITISSKDIEKFASQSAILVNNPELLIRHIIILLEYTLLSESNINEMFINDNFKEEYKKLLKNFDILKSIKEKNLQPLIDRILNSKYIYNEPLFNGFIVSRCNKSEILMIAKNMNEALYKFLKQNYFYNENCSNITQNEILKIISKVIIYTNLLESQKMYNPFFYQSVFANLNTDTASLLIEHYNNNLKRCLYISGTLDSMLDATNLNDIIKLLTAVGTFDKNTRDAQRAITFVIEKIILENNIYGDKFHTYFNEYKISNYNKEYSQFFMENYQKLLELEKSNSGINARIYNEFEDIKNHNTSNKGSQRKLKVTIDKCLDYFLINKFEGFTEEYRYLAQFLAKYFSEPETLNIAIKIINNSKNAPRNIFSSYKKSKDGIIYDNDPKHDLIYSFDNGYTYQWLPKQDLDNLILGKYCNCCAHILGAGAGIAKASMENDNVQNLVVRDKNGLIIAKMTLYINKKSGYGVFNTVEISEKIDKNEFESIYNVFIEGIAAFVKSYNKNNKISIKGISIGDKRNVFKNFLKENNLGEEVFYETLDYSKYKYKIGDTSYGNYPGDALIKQLTIYKN